MELIEIEEKARRLVVQARALKCTGHLLSLLSVAGNWPIPLFPDSLV